MGATTFRTTAVAKTPQAAFQTARDNAAWEYGHGGYTGTIAEKPGFTGPIRVPARMTAARLIDLIDNASAHLHAYDPRDERENERFWRTLPKGINAATLRNIAKTYDDKWGEAVCIELRGREAAEAKAYAGRAGTRDRAFIFCGWASC